MKFLFINSVYFTRNSFLSCLLELKTFDLSYRKKYYSKEYVNLNCIAVNILESRTKCAKYNHLCSRMQFVIYVVKQFNYFTLGNYLINNWLKWVQANQYQTEQSIKLYVIFIYFLFETESWIIFCFSFSFNSVSFSFIAITQILVIYTNSNAMINISKFIRY